jgi:two-component system, OmpR family, KDP operon response regulator KdpE
MSDTDLNILVVDDEPAIRRFLRASLGAHGYTITEAVSGEDALRVAATSHQDIVILDLGLPDMEGVEVTRRLREWTAIPIIILSVREHENDKIAALDAGADDYLTKPFGIGELMARMRVALRRTAQDTSEPIFESDGLIMDFVHREVKINNQLVTLTPTEYDLLRTLVKNAGKVLTHRQLLRTIWGNAYENEMHILRVNISNLRRKIEPDPSQPHYLLTEPGVGYRIKI